MVDINKGLEAGKTAIEIIKEVGHLPRKILIPLKKLNIEFGGGFLDYLEQAQAKYGKVKSILIQQPTNLYDFYVSNPLEMAGKVIETDDINGVLDISKYILILGTGAIGKTTLMKHFFMYTLSKEDIIPIFIELKDINEKNISLKELIYSCINRLGFKHEFTVFEHALKTQTFMLLFDGYDEVIYEKSGLIREQIESMCDQYPNNYYIMTSRRCTDFTSWQRFAEFDAIPFDKTSAIELIDKIPYDNEVKTKFLQCLEDGLYEQHESFLSNPLLLSIMLLTFSSTAGIPLQLHRFYSNAFDALYYKHDASKGAFTRKIKSGLDEGSFKNLLSHFCYKTYFQNKYSFSREELKSCIDILTARDFPEETICADDYIYDLVVSVCILYEEGLDFKFTHRSFQEYFTAVYINKFDDKIQQELYIKLYKGQMFDFSDKVFNMLYEMNPVRFNKNLSAVILKEMIRYYGAFENPALALEMKMFKHYSLGFRKNGNVIPIDDQMKKKMLKDKDFDLSEIIIMRRIADETYWMLVFFDKLYPNIDYSLLGYNDKDLILELFGYKEKVPLETLVENEKVKQKMLNSDTSVHASWIYINNLLRHLEKSLDTFEFDLDF